ncbi:MAG: hypothetical protein EON58_21705 [Alphaproteobacteria bacterium]|nr:MAG: hypothetical protein EON58_21705 [Alphaproteobacteria bacterium]
MKSRTRFVSILAGVCVLGLNVVPAIADSGAARDSPSVQFAFASGESLTSVLDRALERTDRGTLTQVLSSLSDAAANGESINFPGLEDETSEEVSRLLDGASGAIERGSSYPNELSRIEVAPAATPSVVNDPYDSALSSDSVAPLAIASEPLWPSDYEAFGSAINDNRTWAWTTVYEIRDCPPIGPARRLTS